MLDKQILDVYKEMLYDSKIEFEAVMDHMVKYVPQNLYKYKTFYKYFDSNLYDGLIYMASPNEFNDPFDSAPHMDVKEFLRRTERSKYLNLNKIDLNLDEDKDNSFQIIRNEVIKFAHEEMRVSCFSEKYDSLLMWAHYACSHKGYCIEYDTTLMPQNTRRNLLPVIYQDEIYDSTNDMYYNNPNCFNFLLHKSNEWHYEEEWRIATYQKGLLGPIIFKEYISSLIIGLNCSYNDKVSVLKWARKNKKPVYQTEISYEKYALTKKQIL